MRTARALDSRGPRSIFMKKRLANTSVGQYPPLPPQVTVDHRAQARQKNRASAPSIMSAVQRQESTSSADETLPTSVKFDSEDDTCIGEPLVHDFAASNIPAAFRPFNSKEASMSQDSVVEIHPPPKLGPGASVDEETVCALQSPEAARKPINNPSRTSTQQVSFQQPRKPFREYINSSSAPTTPASRERSSADSVISFETIASSIHSLPPLQAKSNLDDVDRLEPVEEDDPKSFDLVTPSDGRERTFSLETRSEEMFSQQHLKEIFVEPALLLRFTNFLSTTRPQSIPLLIYYLDALKALRAISYANAVAEALEPIPGYEFTSHPARPTANAVLEEKAQQAFEAMVRDDLPAYVTHTFIQVVSLSVQRRITGTMPPHLREASEGLAEVFCLTDPSRPDNPIVFASEEFHRTTQYGVSYAIGRNCRFLQGPRTNAYSVERLRKAVEAGREVSEVFLNYRRDGSPFLNLLMIAPLLDSRGNTRYFIGAQVDVSGLAKDCTDLQGLQRLIAKQGLSNDSEQDGDRQDEKKDEFQQLCEMLNMGELETTRRHGGRMHREQVEETDEAPVSHRPRLLLKDPSNETVNSPQAQTRVSGKLEGIYQNYLLVRPYPSLRILFCSPALRVPGILQSPFLSRIGGSSRVRDELGAALAEGRGVTAKVRWVSGRRGDEEGRARWIHCTPLLGHNGTVGVWMIVLVDDDSSFPNRRFRQAPPVATDIGNTRQRAHELEIDATHFVNAYHHSERADEYSKQSAAPAKHSQPMAQRMASMDRNIASPVPDPATVVIPPENRGNGPSARPATGESQQNGTGHESELTSLHSFGLG